MKNLWEVDHPYYCNEGSYYDNSEHYDFKSWDDFISEWGQCDLDMNRIHRFDAHIQSEDYEEIPDGFFFVTFYRIHQRKARTSSQTVCVPIEDQQKVIDYLKPYFELEQKIWAPFTEK